jgi:hypothetical protein
MSLCLWLSLSPVSSSKRTKRTSIHVPQTNHTKTTFRAKNLGKLLTKQQEESKPLLQRLQRKKKKDTGSMFHFIATQSTTKTTIAQTKAKLWYYKRNQSKAKQSKANNL